MKKKARNALITATFLISMTNLGHAFDLDATVDDEIRKNYNSSQLINDTKTNNSALEKNIIHENIKSDENLPSLPNITKQNYAKKESDIKNSSIQPITTSKPYTGGNIKIKAGSSFNVVNTSTISDWQTKGTKVKFTNKSNILGKNYTIPANTVFVGEIVESHQPQISCNGGLVAIKIYSMIYKGQTIPIDAYITRANNKKIFLNTIKGNRTFWKTTWKKGNWGRTLFNKMFSVTLNLGAEGSTFILSPFPLAYGSICLGASAVTSPICAFFSKGGHVSIPADSAFRIKLIEDIMID